MIERNSPITEAELLGFVDGQLSEAEHARIAGLLESNPEQAALAAEWRRQNEGAVSDHRKQCADQARHLAVASCKALNQPGWC